MNNKLLNILIAVLASVAFFSCYEKLTDSLVENKPPKTKIFLYPDSLISQQQSKIKLSWWGDDPDGLVIGYFISWEEGKWIFTKKNDSTISFSIKGQDTNYIFKAAAVDNSGNGIYDSVLIANGINFGHEPFTDLDSNGVFSSKDIFVDCGAVDPNPPSIKLPLKNTSPVVKLLIGRDNSTIEPPETTFTVASFGWTISDLDGDETIQSVFIALNDTSEKIELPGNTRFVTLKAVPPFSSNLISCDVYLGTSISTPYAKKISKLKLDSLNKFYVWAKDIAGAYSSLLVSPSNGKKWFVKKPKGELLVIDDVITLDNSSAFYSSIFDSLNISNKVDFLDIKFGKTANSYGLLLPKYISPMFTETLKLFKYVFWYTDNDPTLEPAQVCVRDFTNKGGKILFSMIFPQLFDPRGLSDFLPVDSISPSPISIIPKSTLVNAEPNALALGYPNLSIDDSPSPVARIRTFYPNTFSSVRLYSLGLTGNPNIGFKSSDSKIVFIGLPLHRSNGSPFKIKDFFREVLFDEFGMTP